MPTRALPRRGDGKKNTEEKPRVVSPRRRRHKAAMEGGGKQPARPLRGGDSPQAPGVGKTPSPPPLSGARRNPGAPPRPGSP